MTLIVVSFVTVMFRRNGDQRPEIKEVVVSGISTELQATPTEANRLVLRTKLLYAIGDIPNAIKLIVFGLFTLYFYTTVMGLPGTLVGIVAGIGLIWDALIDPYIGHLSDHTNSSLGRRHPYMLVGAPLMGISLLLFLSPPQGLSTGVLFTWLLISTLALRTAISIYSVPYFALGSEVSNDYHERTSISGIRTIFALLGTVVTAALIFNVFFPDTIPGVDPKLNYDRYPRMGVTLGLLMTLLGLIAALGTLSMKHRSEKPTVSTPRLALREIFSSFFRALQIVSFRLMFFSFSLFFLGVVANSALAMHYYTYYAKVSSSAALSAFQAAFYIGGATGVGCWLYVSKLVSKHLLYISATTITALIILGSYFLVGNGNLLGEGNVNALIVGHAFGGFFGSVLWFMPWSMMADITDEDELIRGERREGVLIGMLFFGQQLASGLSVLLTGILVDRYAALIPGQAQQSVLTSERIGILYGIIPAGFILIAALLPLRYRLTPTVVADIQSQLAKRKNAEQHDRLRNP